MVVSLEYLDENIYLKEDEIAIDVKEHYIFSLGSSIDKLFAFYGFQYFLSILNKRKESFNVSDLFTDNYGNLLIISYEIAQLEEYDKNMTVFGLLVDPNGEIIDPYGKSEKIDLSLYVKAYPKNVFSEAMNRIKKELENKKKRTEGIYI